VGDELPRDWLPEQDCCFAVRVGTCLHPIFIPFAFPHVTSFLSTHENIKSPLHLTLHQMGLAKHPHNPPHPLRRPHKPHHQETTSSRRQRPNITQISPTQTGPSPTPMPHRPPGEFTPAPPRPQLRALAAQSHLLRRGRIPSLDPLDRATSRTTRRERTT
jgi:hypothetical protein